MRTLPIVTALIILTLANATGEPRPLVPEGWREVPASGQGGERVFVSPNGVARLTLGHVPAHRSNRGRDMDRLMYREGERITYQRRGGSWLAVSGYRNGDIFYRKSNLACRGTRWHIIELEYPREAKVPLDPIVTEIARRMGGHGTECG
jgi:hypothetical protein